MLVAILGVEAAVSNTSLSSPLFSDSQICWPCQQTRSKLASISLLLSQQTPSLAPAGHYRSILGGTRWQAGAEGESIGGQCGRRPWAQRLRASSPKPGRPLSPVHLSRGAEESAGEVSGERPTLSTRPRGDSDGRCSRKTNSAIVGRVLRKNRGHKTTPRGC